MAVTGTITITTLLFLYVAHKRWRVPWWAIVLGGGALLTVDLLFLSANLTKLLHGAWLPLLIGLISFTVLTTWQRGHQIAVAARDKIAGPLPEFVRELSAQRPRLTRLRGTTVFLNRGGETTPLSMRANVDRIHALQEHVIVVSVETSPVPRVSDSERVTVEHLGDPDDGIYFLSARFGYMERPDVPAALRLVDPALTEGPIDVDHASYFLSDIDVTAGRAPVMAPWRKRLFITISRLASDADYFGLPLDRTITIGARIEI
jgi:KUP system potassium uptake protein